MDVKGESLHISGNCKFPSAFYEPPHRKTSAEIINEARHAIRESQTAENTFTPTSIKPLQTQRPFTPRNTERHLFGTKSKSNRPPSSFSLRYLQNETELPIANNTDSNMILCPSMISAGKHNSNSETIKTYGKERSNSIAEINDTKIFNIGLKEVPVGKVRLPSLERPLQKRKIFKNTISLDNLPEENEEIQVHQAVGSRKSFSSPQERTAFNVQETNSPFGRPSKQQGLSQCLLLGPENLEKIFDNRQIIENSTTLFSQKVLDSHKKTVEDVISCLNFESTKRDNDPIVIKLLGEFYSCMENENLLQIKISSKLKLQILKCLYKFVESQNELLLLGIVRIILAIKVTGNNLSGVCKLIFKVAKNAENDHLFLQKNILELFLDALGRSSPLDDAEACIYGYGAVKFLTMNNNVLHKILSLGILELMVLHMKLINNAKMDKIAMTDQTTHAMFQLTAGLRNLAAEETIYDMFNSSGATDQLGRTMEVFSVDADVVSNISRTLSTISTNECCCDKLVENKNIFRIFITLFEKYDGHEEIIVRLTYTLGNIVAKIDNTRVMFYREKKSIESLLHLWKIYLERTLKNCSLVLENEAGNSAGGSEDVMIKIIRVIANMVINPDIGKEVNDNYGLKLIDEFLKVLISNPFKKNGELVLSVLSTLNNLSYYYTTELEHDIFHVKQVDIAEGIAEYAKSTNKECIIESMRILGNLSRSKITRNYLAETEIFQKMIDLLNKDDLLVLKTTIGVFVNLMSDNRSRTLFKKKGGIAKMIRILETYGQQDWSTGTLVCQALWNYSIDCTDLSELYSDVDIQKLLILLADYLDDEKIFGIKDNVEDSELYMTQEYLIWDEFANVATNLLEKIEYFIDTFDHIQLDNTKGVSTMDSSTNISFAAW